MKKYDVSVLAVFRNEESFLPDWINHYLRIGIDHLYLLNDNSTDSSVDIIKSHPSFMECITLVNVDKEDMNYSRYWRQEYLYNKYYGSCLEETKWLGVLDLDEFCYSPYNHNIKKNILPFNHTCIQELIIDWYWFGSNGLDIQPNNIIDSFTFRSKLLSKEISKTNEILNNSYHFEWCCKSFAKTDNIISIRPHFNIFNYNGKPKYVSHGKRLLFSYNLSTQRALYINHYVGAKDYYFSHKAKRCCNNHHTDLTKKIPLYDMINLNEVEDTRLKDQITNG